MKIGFVSPHTFSYPGGVQKHIKNLALEFKKRGHCVRFIFPREEIPQKKDRETILFGGSLYIPANASKTNISFALNEISIYRRLKKEGFDLLHFQNFGIFLPWQILDNSKTLNILTMHANLDGSRFLKLFPDFLNIFNDYILPKFDGLIGVSRVALENINFNGPKTIIPNGIDTTIFKPSIKKIAKLDTQKTNLLFVGRLEKRKGLIYLLRAFKLLQKKKLPLRLIIVGEGPKKGEAKDFIKDNNLKNIFFEGQITDDKLLARYYNSADICVFPSIYGESFGIVLLEAMACAKPVVAFANEGYKCTLENSIGEEFLVKPKDYKTLAEKIEFLVKNPQKQKEMGEWGLQEAQKYNWSQIASKTLEFYQGVGVPLRS